MWLGRSQCPACGTTLQPADLIPFWSWLRTGGRCRHCGAGLSSWYPLVELAAAVIGVLSLWLLPVPNDGIAALLGWWLLRTGRSTFRHGSAEHADAAAAGRRLLRRCCISRLGTPLVGALAGAAAGMGSGAGSRLPPAAWAGRPGARRCEAAGGRRRLAGPRQPAVAGAGGCPTGPAAGIGATAAAAGGDGRPVRPASALAFWEMFMLLAMR